MYIVGFNGPPYSGKDTLARFVADVIDERGFKIPVRLVSHSMPLRKIAYQMVGETYSPASYSAFKEAPFAQFGVTGRQLMIDVSEKFLKPTYGQEIMARMLLDELEGFHGLALVMDSGFQCEIDPLKEAVGPDNLYIVRVLRPDKTFEGDSREWVQHLFSAEVHNDQGLDHLKNLASQVVDDLINRMDWVF